MPKYGAWPADDLLQRLADIQGGALTLRPDLDDAQYHLLPSAWRAFRALRQWLWNREGIRLEIDLSSDVGRWECELGLGAWTARLAVGRSEWSPAEAILRALLAWQIKERREDRRALQNGHGVAANRPGGCDAAKE